MKHLILSFLVLFATTQSSAQADTLRGLEGHNLELGLSSKKGAFAHVEHTDSTQKGNPLVITTQRKKITITSEPRTWASRADSIDDLLKELRTERRNQFTYWSGVDVGLNMLLAPNGSFDLPAEASFMELDQAKSRFISINFMERKFEFGSHHVGLLTGLGWEFNNYRLAKNDLLQFAGDSVSAMSADPIQLSKNKLRQSGLRVPLMFEFNTKRSKIPTKDEVMESLRDTIGGKKPSSFHPDNSRNFHIAVGAVGSWYYDSMYKVRYRAEGDLVKSRDKGDHYLLPYRLAAAVRIGYGSLNLFAEYSLTPLFENNKGPELTPLNIGISIVGFN